VGAVFNILFMYVNNFVSRFIVGFGRAKNVMDEGQYLAIELHPTLAFPKNVEVLEPQAEALHRKFLLRCHHNES